MNSHAPSESYARAALDRECGELARTASGRNDRLNRAAFSLGQLVGAGCLDRGATETRLLEAATANGYLAKDGPATTRSTIRSGLDRGSLEPRGTPVSSKGSADPQRRRGLESSPTIRPSTSAGDAEFPDWTIPDAKGRPRFFAIEKAVVEPITDEVRRHVYRRAGVPVRIKVKLASKSYLNFYRVTRPDDGAVGWQSRKPAGYVPTPYIGPASTINPFDPELIDEPLFWPEGEKDVDNLVAAGALAFTLGGSGDVPEGCADLLHGRRVVILADNDEAGRRCAARKAAVAASAASNVLQVTFSELAEGADVSDWLSDHGGTFEALLDRAIPRAIEAVREPDLCGDEGRFAPPQDGADPHPKIKATPFVWVDPRAIPRRRWLYGRHYIRRYPTATVAPGGLGKTSLILVEALAMVTGKPLLGVPVPDKLRVWIWNGEDPREEIERRIAAACLHYGLTAEEIGDRLFIDSGRDTPIVIAQKLGEGVTVMRPLVDALTAEIRERGIDVMTVDPFVSCHAVPENDNGAIDRVTKAWGGISEAGNCCVELVHHVRKAGAGQTAYTVEDARGGSALIGAVRSARVLNVMSLEEAEKAEVPPSDRRRFFRVDDGKSNMAPPLERAEWRELVGVGLGNDDPDGPEDFVGVVTPWTMPGLFSAVEVGDLRRVQDAIAAGSWAENAQAGNWAGYAVAEALGIDAETGGGKTRIKAMLKAWIQNKALRIERAHDPRAGRDKPMIVVGERV